MTTIRKDRELQLPKAPEPVKTDAPAPAVSPPVAQAHPTPSSSFEKTAWAQTRSGLSGVAPVRALTASATEPVKRTVSFIYDAGPDSVLTDLRLKGSFDAAGKPSSTWTEGIPMRPLGDGRWVAQVDLLDDGSSPKIEWGVTADSPTGNDQWAIFGEGNLQLQLGAETREASYAPTTYHQMGAHKSGQDGISFGFWAPNAKNVQAKITDADGRVERLPMQRSEDGTWKVKTDSGWQRLEGKSYVYEVTTSSGTKADKADPYARVMQGEQVGLSRFYVDPKTGKEGTFFTPGRTELMRFEVDDQPGATEAYLILKGPDGKALTRDQLIARLGKLDPALIQGAREGKYNDLWSENIAPDGKIKLTQVGGSFSTLVNNLEGLAGLKYELRAYAPDASGKLKLIDDVNGDGKLNKLEKRASGYNDRWSDVITPQSGVSFRGAVITDTSYDFKYDGVPRETDRSKWVIYQLHAGSFLGQGHNVNRSTFEDLTAKLDYLKGLGINTLEMMPTNEVEGVRDWGYMGANTLAVESSYGFEDDQGNWVTGDEALKRFIDEAHKRGMNVVNDVVYNHVGGEHNHLWNVDGEQNPYFNWSTKEGEFEQRDTPWGAVPAYHNPKVKQLFVDHAVAQVADYHFDGLRFDFTEPIKGTGGQPGWEMLREINRQVHFLNPNAFTMAEQFDYDPAITEPSQPGGKGGGGFDVQWYTEFQHRLVHDMSNPGLVQAAATGKWTDMDKFMGMLTDPRGLASWTKAVSMISNHDEVGNAQRTLDVADGTSTAKIPHDWARSASRFAAGMGFTGPGTPMFFQGDESLAKNSFKWSIPSTWDLGWDWEKTGQDWDWKGMTFNDQQRSVYERLFPLSSEQREKDPAYRALNAADKKVFTDLARLPQPLRDDAMLNIHRRQTYEFYKSAIALRAASPALQGDAEVKRIHTHNDNSVMAFSRKKGDEEFIVVGSLNHQNLGGYGLELPPGNWTEVFNSDAQAFGGSNFGNEGGTFGSGQQRLDIPAGGYIVLKKTA